MPARADGPTAAERLRRSFTERLPYKVAAVFLAVILWLVASERRLILRSALERATADSPARTPR